MHRHLRPLLTSDRHPDAGWGDGPDPHWAKVGLLLRCEGADGDTTFTDSSSFARTVTRFGAVTSTAQVRWGASSALVASTANTNRLEIAHNAALSATAVDFSIEAWVYFTSIATNAVIFNKSSGGGFYPYQLSTVSGFFQFRGFNAAASLLFDLRSGSAIQLERWYFLQAHRRGAVCALAVDGVVQASQDIGASTVLYENVAHAVSVGGLQGGASSVPVVGYLDDVRFTKGIARPAGVPRGPFTAG